MSLLKKNLYKKKRLMGKIKTKTRKIIVITRELSRKGIIKEIMKIIITFKIISKKIMVTTLKKNSHKFIEKMTQRRNMKRKKRKILKRMCKKIME